MLEIKELLKKFSFLIEKEELKKELIINIIKKITGIDIKKDQIEIVNNNIFLKIKHIYKNEIFLNYEKIISSIKETYPKINKII